jgi:hypothetical protein
MMTLQAALAAGIARIGQVAGCFDLRQEAARWRKRRDPESITVWREFDEQPRTLAGGRRFQGVRVNHMTIDGATRAATRTSVNNQDATT